MEKSGNFGIPALESTNGDVRPPDENYRKNVGEWVMALNNAKRQFVQHDIKCVCIIYDYNGARTNFHFYSVCECLD
jgi:hypothetical protein